MNCSTCGYALAPFETDCSKCAHAKTRPIETPAELPIEAKIPASQGIGWVAPPKPFNEDEAPDSSLWNQAPFRIGLFMSVIGVVGFRLHWAWVRSWQPPSSFDNPTTATIIAVLTTIALFLTGSIGILLMFVGMVMSMFKARRARRSQ